MKAETALITINGRTVLKVLLIPETPNEGAFLAQALAEAESYKLSGALPPEFVTLDKVE